MSDDQERENALLLQPYADARNHAAHDVLTAMLDGRHEDAQRLMTDYQLLCLAYDSAAQICNAFDSGNVTIQDNWVEINLEQGKQD